MPPQRVRDLEAFVGVHRDRPQGPRRTSPHRVPWCSATATCATRTR